MKKAEVEPLHVIVGAVIILIVLIVSVITFTRFFGSSAHQTKCQIAWLDCDCDCDGIKNPIDSCPFEGDQDKETCQKAEKNEKGDTACFDYKDCKCIKTCSGTE